jgi:hypothetical protein|tara:strand:- start:7163 stop:7741 length:579 start_codon:yes stop_codon:yes gene_type:complete
MTQICFDKFCFNLKNIYIIIIVLIGLFIFCNYIIQNPLDNPQKKCAKCITKTFITNPINTAGMNTIRSNNNMQSPPERSYALTKRSMPQQTGNGIPINIPTQGEPTSFQKVGVLTNNSNDPDNARLPLFGRPKYPGSNDYDYYVMDGSRNGNKIAIDSKKELDTDDEIAVPSFNGSYKVSLYSYDQPKYIPF